MDCGASTEWGQSAETNRIDYVLGPLCESGGIQTLIAAALAFEGLMHRLGPGAGGGGLEWTVSVHRYWDPFSLNIPLPGVFKGCAGHRIWPRNEYGDWHRSAPVVVESEPMANARNPADPDKVQPYWHSVRQPQTPKPRSTAKPQLEPGKRVDGSDLDDGPPGSNVGSTKAAHAVYS
jgi:hypothetical protein